MHCWSADHLHGNAWHMWLCAASFASKPWLRDFCFPALRAVTEFELNCRSVRMPFPIKRVSAFCFSNVDTWSHECSTCVCWHVTAFCTSGLKHTQFHSCSKCAAVLGTACQWSVCLITCGLGSVCKGRHRLDGPLCLGGNLFAGDASGSNSAAVFILHKFSDKHICLAYAPGC